jgi:hypothetical protein
MVEKSGFLTVRFRGLKGDYSTLAQVRDSDGNLLTLATRLSRPYPPA